MPLAQTSAPAREPVGVDEAKVYLRVEHSVDDDLIGMLIGAARRYAESFCGRSFITQSWLLTLDGFDGCPVRLERGDVLSVDSITYQSMDGAWVTMPSTDYVADLSGALPRITPVFGKPWPITLPQIGSVRIAYTAGYGAAPASVPEGIRHWILMRLAGLYENREEVVVLNRGKVDPLPYVDALLDPYRIVTL
jgi:uncharacterized phiE125 gp8 family phage protein